VLNSCTGILPSWHSIVHLGQKSLAILLGTASMALASTSFTATQAIEAPAHSLHAQAESMPRSGSTSFQPLSDGVYLYGESPQANQIGAGYMVFNIHQSQIVGALYMPYSSFDCFHGQFQHNQLAMTVVDTYEHTSYPFAVALQPDTSVASTNGAIAPLGLEGFHRIATVSDNDRRILATCQADLQHSN